MRVRTAGDPAGPYDSIDQLALIGDGVDITLYRPHIVDEHGNTVVESEELLITLAAAGGGGGSGPATGSGSPTGVVTPADGIGSQYIDTTNGSLFVATGTTNTDWSVIGGKLSPSSLGEVGVFRLGVNGRGVYIMPPAVGGASINFTDALAFSGTGNGLEYNVTGTDGEQTLTLFLGPTGTLIWRWQADGQTVLPGELRVKTGLGAWDVTPPGSQPAAPATLGDVIAALQAAGLVGT